MIDTWILQDIGRLIATRKRVVLLDPTEQFAYLLPVISKHGYVILKTESAKIEKWETVKEELFLRYDAESKYKSDKVIFYVTRQQSKLSFLFDYCFTHGCVDLSDPAEWLKKKLFSNTGLQVSLENPLLLTAAKESIGKNIDWWKKILLGIDQIIDLEEELLPFIDHPDNYRSSKDKDVYALFENKLFELICQPYRSIPPKVLASEIVKTIFDQLLNNEINPQLLNVYYKWLDSNTFADALKKNIADYNIGYDLNIWNVHPDHCFSIIDLKQLNQIVKNFRDKSYVKDKLQKLLPRIKSRKAGHFVPSWWVDVKSIVEFDNKPLNVCDSFEKVVQYYTNDFHKLDRAIRNIYAVFINDEDIVRPFQELYESLNYELLQHWFDYSKEYKSNQQGFLPQLLMHAKPKTAIIVGDGVRYEIAYFIANQLQKKVKVKMETMLADMPSETEHNMSALYIGQNEVLIAHKEREKRLAELSGKDLSYLSLESLNYGTNADYLVLTYKDIDSAGEKLQLGAIKLFNEFEKVITEKIELLLNMGYQEVHLVTDHGFVLTGLLDESDKVDPDVIGKKDVHERYIRTKDKQDKSDWAFFESVYGEYNYVYTAKTHKPFKSKGLYGFSHGGFTPQEIIVPHFIFSKDDLVTNGLTVNVINKTELSDVTGDIFSLKIQSEGKADDLFAASRKIQVLLYTDNINFSSSSIVTVETGKSASFEFSFCGKNEIHAIIVDAITREQLDSVKIKKSNARDLGGLL